MDALRADTSYAYFELRDGMIFCFLKPDLIVDERTARKVTEQRCHLVGAWTVPTMIVLHEDYLHFEPSAFRYFGSPAGLVASSATAIVIQRPLRTILTNFSLLFQRTNVPFRVFTNKAEARLWLFTFVHVEVPDDPVA